MKINYILETVEQNNLKDRTVESFDKNEITLGRGSDSDILFSSRLISYNHARLMLDQDKLYVESIGKESGFIRVNNSPVQKSSLKDGDVLRLGDVTLKIGFNEYGWNIFETRNIAVENQEEALEKAVLQLDITNRMPSQLFLALALVLPMILIFGVGPYQGINLGAWEAGPLSDSHKFLKKDCVACHEKTFQKVQDTACTKCHAMGDHVKFLSTNAHLNERCGFCHHDHSGNDHLILRGDQLCLNCHFNLGELNSETKLLSINGFNRSHPEFGLLRTRLSDKARVKLNHNYHLTAIEIDDHKTNKKRAMKCVDCHISDGQGNYMKPISFDEFCADCHKLKLGGAAHMLRVPHVKTTLVRSFLKSPRDFLFEHIDSNPGSLLETAKSSSRGRRRRGPPPQPVQKLKKGWVDKNIEAIEQRGGLLKSENDVYFSGKGGCIECHFLDVGPIAILSPDSARTAISLWSHDVRLWNIETEKDEAIFKGHGDIVKTATFSDNGKWLLTGSRDFTARIWEIPERIVPEFGEISGSRKEDEKGGLLGSHLSEGAIKVFKKHSGAVNDVQFGPELSKIATASSDKTAIIWDVEEQKPIHILAGHKSPIEKIGFNSDGTLIYTRTAEFSAKVWNVATGKEVADLESSFYQINDISFHPTEPNKLAAAFSDGSIKILLARGGKVLSVFKRSNNPLEENSGHRLEVTKVIFSPDGSKLLSLAADFTGKVWDLVSGKLLTTLVVWDKKKKSRQLKNQIFLAAEFDVHGEKIITGCSDKMIRVWDASSGEMLNELKSHESPVLKVDWNYDGTRAVTVSNNNFAALWDLEAKTSVSFRHSDVEIEDVENNLLPPISLPTNIPTRFMPKSFFSHRKHEYLDCKDCHKVVDESVLTSDILMPGIKECKVCHEKDGIKLNECSMCHYYHPEELRNYVTGPLRLDNTAEFGFSYLEPKKNG